MALENSKEALENGFEGAVSGMTLADLIQIKNLNRFTGCLSVKHRGKTGFIFFREGELVHAELDGLSGSEAFFSIMLWPGGEFRAESKIATTYQTISENLTFLLLESHRLKDEQKRISSLSAANKLTASLSPGEQNMSDINRKLKAITEVEYAVVLTKKGETVDDSSYEGSTHSANAYYLSLFTNKLGNQLGTGEMISAAVHGSDRHLLLFQSKNHYLSVAVSGNSQLGAVESVIKKALTQK
ncbi:MAG TPA: DUF4388 domain-containing protein [Desulfuromonadaceae bacterium]|jgi:hypothetical protein